MKSTFPTITAHTGCDGTAENTVESALAGLRLGADCVEVDVRSDPDGVLYLRHDEALGEARALRRPTTLAELTATLAPLDGWINLDLKDDRSATLVGAAVTAAGLSHRALITGCEIERVALARAASPALPVYLNTSFGGASPESLDRGRIEAECRKAQEAGCWGLNIHHRFCTPSLVETARSHALLVSVWTVRPEDGFMRFVELGVDNITTRHVAELVTARDRRWDAWSGL